MHIPPGSYVKKTDFYHKLTKLVKLVKKVLTGGLVIIYACINDTKQERNWLADNPVSFMLVSPLFVLVLEAIAMNAIASFLFGDSLTADNIIPNKKAYSENHALSKVA
jgi:hypothetical protein